MPTPCTKWRNVNQESCFQVLQGDVKMKYPFRGNGFVAQEYIKMMNNCKLIYETCIQITF